MCQRCFEEKVNRTNRNNECEGAGDRWSGKMCETKSKMWVTQHKLSVKIIPFQFHYTVARANIPTNAWKCVAFFKVFAIMKLDSLFGEHVLIANDLKLNRTRNARAEYSWAHLWSMDKKLNNIENGTCQIAHGNDDSSGELVNKLIASADAILVSSLFANNWVVPFMHRTYMYVCMCVRECCTFDDVDAIRYFAQ